MSHRLHTIRMENDAAGYAMAEMRPRFEAMKARHETGTAPRAVSAYQLFQTPPEIAGRMAALLNLQPGETVLEPSAGLGRLLDAIEPMEPGPVVAVEVSNVCASVLYGQERDGVEILQRDFLSVDPTPYGYPSFDAVIMNPPFHMRSDVKHIEHALRFLKPGGRLVALCLNTRHRVEAFKSRAEQWVELESRSFRSEGTGVSVCMMKIVRPG